MKMYMAKVRLSSAQLIEMEVIANTPHEAKQMLEMQFGEGNVVYYPREII